MDPAPTFPPRSAARRCALAAAALMACSATVWPATPAAPIAPVPAGRPLVYAMYADIKDWDPSTAASTEVVLLSNVYEPLVWYAPPTAGAAGPVPGRAGTPKLLPALATAWSVSPDGKQWTFTLRRNVKFHDGEVFDAAAAKASIERVKKLNKGSAYIWEAVESIGTPDPGTLVIRTRTPVPVDLIASSQYAAYMVSPKALQAGADWFNQGQAAGTGPYKVRQWTRGQQVALERHEAYWGGWKPGQFGSVMLKVVQEAATQARMIRSGEADFITQPPAELVKALARDPGVTVLSGPSWRNTQFLINTRKPPTDNLQFRRALAHAWDYAAVVNQVYEGGATRASGVIPATMWGHDPAALTLPAFDLARAQQLVDGSGVPPAQRRLVATCVASSTAYRRSLELFRDNLARIGIALEIRPGPWEQVWDEAKRADAAPHLVSMTWWPSYATPSDWLIGLFRSEEPTVFNLSRYANPRFDRLVNRGVLWEAVDRGTAAVNYAYAQQLLVDDAAAIFVADLKGLVIHRRHVRGVVLNPAYDAVNFYGLSTN